LADTGCAKQVAVAPFWYPSFLPLLDALFAIFVYLHIIFIKYLISEPSIVSIQMDSPAGWCTIAHCKQHDTLPQKGECFIHRASGCGLQTALIKTPLIMLLGVALQQQI